MCSMEEIASCQISFIPINSNNYIEDINLVLDLIKNSELEYNTNILSTTIRGDKNKIFKLIEYIYDTLDEKCSFTMDVKLSNICGCEK